MFVYGWSAAVHRRDGPGRVITTLRAVLAGRCRWCGVSRQPPGADNHQDRDDDDDETP
jgi:hypothetical protein